MEIFETVMDWIEFRLALRQERKRRRLRPRRATVMKERLTTRIGRLIIK